MNTREYLLLLDALDPERAAFRWVDDGDPDLYVTLRVPRAAWEEQGRPVVVRFELHAQTVDF